MGKARSVLESQERALARARRFVERARVVCRERGYRLIGAYLVGSRARGDYIETSDIDIVLVVEGIEGLDRLRRLEVFKEILEPEIDLFIYTPDEWHREESLWIKKMREEAIQIL